VLTEFDCVEEKHQQGNSCEGLLLSRNKRKKKKKKKKKKSVC